MVLENTREGCTYLVSSRPCACCLLRAPVWDEPPETEIRDLDPIATAENIRRLHAERPGIRIEIELDTRRCATEKFVQPGTGNPSHIQTTLGRYGEVMLSLLG